ncbi:MAG: hypothetical protein NT159_21780 [Proteobacteria bacterium]|nr:hypothetical protein [Pseudomonadota bacterium]
MKHVLAIALCAVAFSAFGHGGEDHDAPPPAPTSSQSVAPRAAVATEDFEVVAALEGQHLLVYVDRFASNEPVTNARVEIEGAGLKGFARETAPGAYVMDVATAISPAKHPLTITIEAGDITDLLSTTLDTTLPPASSEHVRGWSEQVVWIIAGLLLLAAGALLAAWRYRANKGN